MSTSYASTTSADSPEAFRAQRLQNARHNLVTTGLYLGENAFRSQVVWRHVGRSNELVTKTSAEAVAAAQNAQLGSDAPDVAISASLEPAILSVITQISDDDYWLTPCAMWRGSTSAAATLADAKATCIGGASRHVVIAPDFTKFLTNIRWIMDQTRTPCYKRQEGVVVDGLLKFRHVLFEVRLCSLLLFAFI
jgi:hypothetical protein